MEKIFLIAALFFSFISVSAQQKKDSQGAMNLNDRAISIHMRNLSNKDSTAKVLNLLDEAIALDHSYLRAYENKVDILFLEKEYGEAVRTLDKAIKYNPEVHGLYVLKAKALEEQGQSEEALVCYKKALDMCETEMNENPKANSFLDRYFLKYCVYGIDTPASEVMAAIPSFFTDEQRRNITDFFDMIGSFKNYKDGWIKNQSLPLNSKTSAMPLK